LAQQDVAGKERRNRILIFDHVPVSRKRRHFAAAGEIPYACLRQVTVDGKNSATSPATGATTIADSFAALFPLTLRLLSAGDRWRDHHQPAAGSGSKAYPERGALSASGQDPLLRH